MGIDIHSYYESYFRDIAARLGDIAHNEIVPRFWMNSDANSLSEIKTAVRNKLKLPCLIIDALEYDIPVGNDNVREIVTGLFLVLVKFEQGDTKSLMNARNQARNIANKIRNYMILDVNPSPQAVMNENSLFRQGVRFYEDIQGDYSNIVEGVAVGFYYEFRWEIPVDLSFGASDFLPLG